MKGNLNAFGLQAAEVTIEPDVTGFDLADFTRAQELAAIGEQAALGQKLMFDFVPTHVGHCRTLSNSPPQLGNDRKQSDTQVKSGS